MDEEYRCEQTIDLEEYLMSDKKKTQYEIRATYKSGREESFHGKITASGGLNKRDSKIYNDLKSFPTIEKVEVIKS